MKRKYRIVSDSYAGFECQTWVWYWPFWVQMNWVNTFTSLEKAKEYIQNDRVVHWRSDVGGFVPASEVQYTVPPVAALGVDEKGNILWPHTCPVCNGKTVVPAGFYNIHALSQTTNATPEPCRTCQGAGIVWG